MRAVGLFTHGGPEVLQVVELPEVHAGPGQVRIRVHAATVNPTDVGVRNGTRAEQQKADPPPYVPGMEAAGRRKFAERRNAAMGGRLRPFRVGFRGLRATRPVERSEGPRWRQTGE